MWKHFLHNILLGSSFSQYFINLLVLLHSPLFCEKGTTVSTHTSLYYKLKMAPNVFVMEKHLCPLAKLDLITR